MENAAVPKLKEGQIIRVPSANMGDVLKIVEHMPKFSRPTHPEEFGMLGILCTCNVQIGTFREARKKEYGANLLLY